MKSLGLLVNGNKKNVAIIAEEIVFFLREMGLDPRITTTVARDDHFLDELDLCITLGGDGTLLGVAADAAEAEVPLLGINCGNLGFLTALGRDNWREELGNILRGERVVLRENLLRCTIGGRSFLALNDVVIKNQSSIRLFDLSVAVDDAPLADYRADGLIISTPLGSTAYSLSAGGAILTPSVAAVVLTPICPHTLSNRSVVLPSSSEITVKVARGGGNLHLCVDGRDVPNVAAEGSISLALSPHRVTIFQRHGYSYFDTLREKLGWNRP